MNNSSEQMSHVIVDGIAIVWSFENKPVETRNTIPLGTYTKDIVSMFDITFITRTLNSILKNDENKQEI